MNLVKFLTIATIFSLGLGELGRYPFGNSVFALRVTDILIGLTLGFLAIWQIGIKKNILVPKYFVLIIFFWVVGIISLVWSGNLSGFFYLVRFVLYSLVFWLGYSLIKSEAISIKQLFKYLVAVGVIISFLGFLQLLIFPDFEFLIEYGYDPHKFRLASTFLDPNYLGVFLNILLLLTFYLYSKKFNFLKEKKVILIQMLFVISILLTLSRSAFLMLFSSIFLLGIIKNRWLLIPLILSIFLIYLFVPSVSGRVYNGIILDESARERLISWENGLIIFKQEPLLGVGFNNLRQSLEKNNLFKVYSKDGGHAGTGIDSSFIFLLATTGVVGFLTYLSFWLFVINVNLQKGFKNSYLPAISIILIVTLFINSQFINSLFYAPIMFVFYLVLGAIFAEES